MKRTAGAPSGSAADAGPGLASKAEDKNDHLPVASSSSSSSFLVAPSMDPSSSSTSTTFKRKRQKCPGRNAEGVSLCTFCASVGIPCTYQKTGEASRYDQALRDANELKSLRDFVEQLQGADEDQRRDLLRGWKGNSDSEDADRNRGVTGHKKRLKKSEQEVETTGDLALPISSNRLGHIVEASELIELRQAGECESCTERWITSALDEAAQECYVGPELKTVLLDTFFCWQNPRFGLSRQLFTESMRIQDPTFYNDFLLWSIIVYAARFVPEANVYRDIYCARAQCYLAAELTRAASLPTIQGLLLLAMHHSSRGRYSQGFMHIGMAQRMLQDPQLRQEDGKTATEIRLLKRAHWSVFHWSVTFSLLVNRPPTFPPPASCRREELASDQEIADEARAQWKPYFSPGDSSAVDLSAQPSFPITTFVLTCQAFQFIYDILVNLYSGEPLPRLKAHAFVQETRDKLVPWQSAIRSEILLDVDLLPAVVPPPHIVQLNVLIRSAWILLYRKFDESFQSSSPVAGANAASKLSAREIYAILNYYENTFSILRLHYFGVFAAEMAAVTDAQAFRTATPGEKQELCKRLTVYLRVLETGEVNCPGVPSIVQALRKELVSFAAQQLSSSKQVEQPSTTTLPMISTSAPTPRGAQQNQTPFLGPQALPPRHKLLTIQTADSPDSTQPSFDYGHLNQMQILPLVSGEFSQVGTTDAAQLGTVAAAKDRNAAILGTFASNQISGIENAEAISTANLDHLLDVFVNGVEDGWVFNSGREDPTLHGLWQGSWPDWV